MSTALRARSLLSPPCTHLWPPFLHGAMLNCSCTRPPRHTLEDWTTTSIICHIANMQNTNKQKLSEYGSIRPPVHFLNKRKKLLTVFTGESEARKQPSGVLIFLFCPQILCFAKVSAEVEGESHKLLEVRNEAEKHGPQDMGNDVPICMHREDPDFSGEGGF